MDNSIKLRDFEKRFVDAFTRGIEDASSFAQTRNNAGALMLKKSAPCKEFGYLGILVPEPGMIVIGCEITQTSLYAWHHEGETKDPEQRMIDEALQLVNNILRGHARAKVVHNKDGKPALSGFYKSQEVPLSIGGSSALIEKHFGGEASVTEYAWAGLIKH